MLTRVYTPTRRPDKGLKRVPLFLLQKEVLFPKVIEDIFCQKIRVPRRHHMGSVHVRSGPGVGHQGTLNPESLVVMLQ